MIENLNDFLSFWIVALLLAYMLYRIFKAISYARLRKHIRDEQKYYKNWYEDEQKKG